MVEPVVVWRQLTTLKFGFTSWNRKEIKQLPKLLEPGERILECLNGWYENGLALLVATDRRVLLVDQKAFNFLKVESLELHEIDKVDHGHHIMGSRLTIKTQSAILHFRSMNRLRLRRLMDRLLGRLFELQQWQREQVEASHQHLQDVNKQLQDYAIAQHEQLQQALSGTPPAAMNPPKVDHKLADYLFAQQLLKKYGPRDAPAPIIARAAVAAATKAEDAIVQNVSHPAYGRINNADLLGDARLEILGRAKATPVGF